MKKKVVICQFCLAAFYEIIIKYSNKPKCLYLK